MGSRFRALAWGTREDMLVKYEPNPKHKPIPTPGRRGSICPSGVDGPRLLCCLLYTSDAADERSCVDLGGRRFLKKKTK